MKKARTVKTTPADTLTAKALTDIKAKFAHSSSQRIEAKLIMLGHERDMLDSAKIRLEEDLRGIRRRQSELAGEMSGLEETLATREVIGVGAITQRW